MQLHPARVRPSIRLLKLPAGGLRVPPGAAAASGSESQPGPALQDRTAGGPKSSVMCSHWCVLDSEDGLRFESQAQLQLRGSASDSGPAGVPRLRAQASNIFLTFPAARTLRGRITVQRAGYHCPILICKARFHNPSILICTCKRSS